MMLMVLGGAPATDFGVRTVGSVIRTQPVQPRAVVGTAARFDLHQAAVVVGRYGRVTSLRRSAERNRRVGGVSNSWHLHGRAIDVVRSPSVSHAALAGTLRSLGYHLIESLDEGDHSHFAFGTGAAEPHRTLGQQIAEVRREADYFRFIEFPASSSVRRRSALR